MTAQRPTQSRFARGFGLIELMISITIGTFLLLGLSEVFQASRTAFMTSQGASEVQENARFAMGFLQRDARMVGHMGCINDEARFLSSQPTFFSHFLTTAQRGTNPPGWAAAPFWERFDISIQGYDAANSTPGQAGNLTLAFPGSGGAWAGNTASGFTDTLPAQFPAGAGIPLPLAGSDILVLRFFGTSSAPVVQIALNNPVGTNNVAVTSPAFRALEAAQPTGLYGIANCLDASVFQSTGVTAGLVGGVPASIVTAGAASNASGFSTGENYPVGDLSIYPAESMIYYVGVPNDTSGRTVPSLFRLHYTATGTPVPEEIVEGIDNMQILYGRDTTPSGSLTPQGAVLEYDTATTINAAQAAAPYAPDPNSLWRHVGSVRIALLARSITPGNEASPNTANTPSGCIGVSNCYSMLGVNVIPPPKTAGGGGADGNYREVYTTTIAMRNRLFGN
jgi:type IV pilus assembly protein PilW